MDQKAVDAVIDRHGKTARLPGRSSKTLILSGAVTDLEDRHSMALERFFDLFGENGFYESQCLLRIVIQCDLENRADVRGIQCELYRFQVHILIFRL